MWTFHRFLAALLLALSVTAATAQRVSTTGSCGNGVTCQGSTFGVCCSAAGFCGTGASYCGPGCQSDFGTCQSGFANVSPSDDGSCGSTSPHGYTCQGSELGNCCSPHGFCGRNSTYCGTGCQVGYGSCGVGAGGNSTDDGSDGSGLASASASSSSTPTSSTNSSTTAPTGTATNANASTTSVGAGAANAGKNAQSPGSSSVVLSAGAMAGIVVGAVAAVLLIVGAVAFLFLRRRRRQLPTELHPSTARIEKDSQPAGAELVSWTGIEKDGNPCQSELPSTESENSWRSSQDIKSATFFRGVSPDQSSQERAAELPAYPRDMATPDPRNEMARVDERAAAGYDGAYRGH